MSQLGSLIVFFVVLLILIIIISTLLLARPTAFPPATVAPTAATSPVVVTPTAPAQQAPLNGNGTNTGASPTMQSYTGRITNISTQPVQFKNAIVVTIASGGNQTPLYISSSTTISGPSNAQMNKDQLQVGQTVMATGLPAEGGIDASTIKVQ